MPIDTGFFMDRLNKTDQWLYDKTMPNLQKFGRFYQQGLPEAVYTGIAKGSRHIVTGFTEATGMSYVGAGVKHYAKFFSGGYAHPTRGLTRAEAPAMDLWGKYFQSVESIRAPTIYPLERRISAFSQKWMTFGRRLGGAGGVLMRGVAPALALHMASQDEMGFGIGMAKQLAGWTAWGFGASAGLQLGGWAGGTVASGIAGAVGKIPGIKKIATTGLGKMAGRAAGAFLGGPVGWLIGGLAAFETASWAVGFALHTLPTFAKQYRAEMALSGYGGDYTDSAGAATMRQRSLQVMGKSHMNARSALGQEGALLHA